jgi:hypothetical protein
MEKPGHYTLQIHKKSASPIQKSGGRPNKSTDLFQKNNGPAPPSGVDSPTQEEYP